MRNWSENFKGKTTCMKVALEKSESVEAAEVVFQQALINLNEYIRKKCAELQKLPYIDRIDD